MYWQGDLQDVLEYQQLREASLKVKLLVIPCQDHQQELLSLIQLRSLKLRTTMQFTRRVLLWVTLHMQKMAVDFQEAVK